MSRSTNKYVKFFVCYYPSGNKKVQGYYCLMKTRNLNRSNIESGLILMKMEQCRKSVCTNPDFGRPGTLSIQTSRQAARDHSYRCRSIREDENRSQTV